MTTANSNPLPPEVAKELQQTYLAGLPAKISEIQSLTKQLSSTPSLESLKALRVLIHKMVGSAGTYGFPLVSSLCKPWDMRLMEFIEHFPACQKDLSWLQELGQLPEQLKKGFSQHE